MYFLLKTVAPTIVPAAYGAGDVVGTPVEITKALISTGGQAMLRSLVVIDKADQKAHLDLYFFDSQPASSVGADNAAFAPTDADMTKCLGRINIPQASYLSAGSNAEQTLRDLNLMLQAAPSRASGQAGDSLWMVVVARGTPTYASASDLQIRLGLEQQ